MAPRIITADERLSKAGAKTTMVTLAPSGVGKTSPLKTLPPAAISIHPDATSYSGLSRSALYLLMKSGDVESVKIGKRRLILFQSLGDFLARQPRVR
jgi:hypothetical protein